MFEIKSWSKYLLVCVVGLTILSSCQKDDYSPFGGDDIPTDNQQASNPDPTTIAGLYKNIFTPKCAFPSCHGGTFEPDFTSITSSYNTLVYQPVVKNTIDEKFTWRVIPYDTTKSWLYHRVTVEDTLIPRMPIYADELTVEDIRNIKAWIMNGAKDMQGNVAIKPNALPKIYGYSAFDASFNQIDDNRTAWSSPFYVNHGSVIHIWSYVDDEETQTINLLENKLLLSTNRDNFSNAVQVNAVYMNGPVCWGWVCTINTATLPNNTTIYMRYSVRDPQHTTSVLRPTADDYSWNRGNYSFQLQ